MTISIFADSLGGTGQELFGLLSSQSTPGPPGRMFPSTFTPVDMTLTGTVNVIAEPTSVASWSIAGLGLVGFRCFRARRKK